WDFKTRAILRQLEDPDKTVNAACVSDAGGLIAVSTEFRDFQKGGFGNVGPSARPTDMYRENRVKIYDMEHGGIAKTLEGLSGEAVALSFSADDRFLAVVRQKIRDNSVAIYDVRRGVEVSTMPLQSAGAAAAFG